MPYPIQFQHPYKTKYMKNEKKLHCNAESSSNEIERTGYEN